MFFGFPHALDTGENEESTMNYAPRALSSSAAQADVKTRARFIMRTYGHLLAAILAFASLEVFFFTSGLARPIAGLLLTSGMGWLLVLGYWLGKQRSLPLGCGRSGFIEAPQMLKTSP